VKLWNKALSWFLMLVGMIFAVGMLSKQVGWPPELWQRYGTQLSLGLFALGLPAQVGLMWRSFQYIRLKREQAQLRIINELCNLLLVQFATALPAIPALALGVNVWVVKGAFGWKRLRKATSFRMFRANESAIEWTRGKGAIGRCWKSETDRFFDLRELNEAAVSAGDTAYGGLPEELTLGLSWEEWQKTRQFNAIYTWALREERKGKFVGCLSLDCTYSRGVELIPMTAAANEVSALVGLLAKAVVDVEGDA